MRRGGRRSSLAALHSPKLPAHDLARYCSISTSQAELGLPRGRSKCIWHSRVGCSCGQPRAWATRAATQRTQLCMASALSTKRKRRCASPPPSVTCSLNACSVGAFHPLTPSFRCYAAEGSAWDRAAGAGGCGSRALACHRKQRRHCRHIGVLEALVARDAAKGRTAGSAYLPVLVEEELRRGEHHIAPGRGEHHPTLHQHHARQQASFGPWLAFALGLPNGPHAGRGCTLLCG